MVASRPGRARLPGRAPPRPRGDHAARHPLSRRHCVRAADRAGGRVGRGLRPLAERSAAVTPGSRTILALGGHEFSRKRGNEALRDYMLALADGPRPKICLLPTASGDPADQIAAFRASLGGLSCELSHVSLFRLETEAVDLADHLLAQDLIYVGGGSMLNLLAIWRAHGIDDVLRRCWERGVVMAGQSAGAMCWFEWGDHPLGRSRSAGARAWADLRHSERPLPPRPRPPLEAVGPSRRARHHRLRGRRRRRDPDPRGRGLRRGHRPRGRRCLAGDRRRDRSRQRGPDGLDAAAVTQAGDRRAPRRRGRDARSCERAAARRGAGSRR